MHLCKVNISYIPGSYSTTRHNFTQTEYCFSEYC